MAELVTMLASPAVTSQSRPYVPANLILDTVDGNPIWDSVNITIAGKTTQAVSGQAVIGAIMRYMNECMLGADVKIGSIWRIATGWMDKNTQFRFTNSGATTPVVRDWSDSRNGVPILIGQEECQGNSRLDYSTLDPERDFTAIFLDPTNFNYGAFEFSDGHTEELNAAELAARFNVTNQCDADGLLNGILVIDNSDRQIVRCTLYATNSAFTATKYLAKL